MPEVFPFGLFIKRIEQTKTSDESGGENIFTVELTDHSRRQFKVRNGAKGDTGDAAGIKEITASIDNGIGVPSVTVTSTGSGAEKTVHFDFKNLKGEKGSIALTEEVKQHITESITAANQHADTGDDNTLKSAKSYTDQKVQAEAQASIKRDADVLSATGKYIDQKMQAEVQARTKGDADTLKSAKDYMDGLLIKIFQNGYIQWTGMPSPLEDTALHFEGYSWYEVNYNGNFFRAKGRNAKAFSNKRLTKEQIKDGAYVFQDDEQGDAIRNIYGSVVMNAANSFIAARGVFSRRPDSGTGSHAQWAWTGGQKKIEELVLNLEGFVPTAEENRSRNLTFTIWVLVKD